MAEESMWGEVPERGKGIKLPYDYLNEQATILSKLYRYRLRGEVIQEVSSSGRMSLDFDISVPDLGSYRYSLLKVVHPLKIYPLILYGVANKKDYKCDDEETFKEALRETLSSREVGKTLEDILTLIKK